MSSLNGGPDGRSDRTLVTDEILSRVLDQMRDVCPSCRQLMLSEPVLEQFLERKFGTVLASMKNLDVPQRIIDDWAERVRTGLLVSAAALRAGYLRLLADFMPQEEEAQDDMERADVIDPKDSPF